MDPLLPGWLSFVSGLLALACQGCAAIVLEPAVGLARQGHFDESGPQGG